MKLQRFLIQYYKSIINSGVCYISEFDNITILAGQNESLKSSILEALHDYHRDTMTPKAARITNETASHQQNSSTTDERNAKR